MEDNVGKGSKEMVNEKDGSKNGLELGGFDEISKEIEKNGGGFGEKRLRGVVIDRIVKRYIIEGKLRKKKVEK